MFIVILFEKSMKYHKFCVDVSQNKYRLTY